MAYEFRISYWSSDVCSSDLIATEHAARALDRGGEPGIDAAAADIGDRGLDLGVGRGCVLLEQHRGGHDDTGDAEAALRHVGVDEGELERMIALARQPLDRKSTRLNSSH